jgi:hypothetical protein
MTKPSNPSLPDGITASSSSSFPNHGSSADVNSTCQQTLTAIITSFHQSTGSYST